MDTDPAALLVINKNQEMQRIYCCDNKMQLERRGKEKAKKKESTQALLEQQV